jgi:hypothetical protein
MAPGTILRPFSGSGAVLLMATNALLMKSVGMFGILRIFDIGGIVAFQAIFGNNPFLGIGLVALSASDQGLVIVRGMVMAIETVKAIPVCGSVGIVVKEDFAGIGLVHQADGLSRCFDRKGGIAYDGNQKQVDRHAVSDQTVLLRSHLHKFLTVLGGCTLFTER